ncbi:MAG: response regulator [Bacteroidales bacterium]|nr:response regulator [Bacteroidales bacterium]
MNSTYLYIVLSLLTVILAYCIYVIYKQRECLSGASKRTNQYKVISGLNNDLSMLMKTAGLSAWLYDIESGTREIIYGKQIFPEIVAKDNYDRSVHPDDIQLLIDMKRRLEKGESSEEHGVVRYLPENEFVTYRYLEYFCIAKKSDGKIDKIACINRDLTTQILYQQALEESREKMSNLSHEFEKNNLLLKAIIDRMPCLLFIKDADDDYRYIIANSMFCKSIGKPENEVVGHTEYDLQNTKEEADHFRKDDIEAMGKGIISFREETLWCGIRTVWHTYKSSFTTSSGQHLLIGMSLDVTTLDDTLAQFRKAKEKAERSDLLKSAFLANMSHEIRTPLNAIIGFSDLIIHSDNKDEQDVYSKIILDNSDLLLKLINDILDMSKIEAGFIDLKISPIELSSLFNDFKQSFSPRMKNGVEFTCVNPYHNYFIESDKNRIIQVVNNFMSNAIKYTPSGHIKLGYEQCDEGIKIYVEDSGIGIKDEDKPRVFSRFEKFDSFAQGTGLGLSICKVIAESIGGKVGFESKYNVGSIFHIWIPKQHITDDNIASIEQTSAITENARTVTQARKKIKILVAEDNDSNFILIQAILKSYMVDRAKNGLDAVNMAKMNNYSIIFMDIKMPVMGGLEATRKIRAFDNIIPIVALTANAFDSDKEDALEAGCTSYISKPIKFNDITNIMEGNFD